jgi:hypothetical protein
MKKIMMIAVMAVMCLTASAQNHRRDGGAITVQPMIGLSVGTWRGETSGTTSTSNDARVGLAIGAEGEYYTSTDWLSISAAVKYEQLGWKFNDVDAAKVDYINIPVMANFYVAKGFALKVGLQPGFLVNAKQGSVDFKDKCKTFNLAIPVGLSYEFKNGITLDLRGGYSLTRLDKNGGSDYKDYCDGGSLTIGYKFSVK